MRKNNVFCSMGRITTYTVSEFQNMMAKKCREAALSRRLLSRQSESEVKGGRTSVNLPVLKSKFIIPDIPGTALYSERIRSLNIAGSRACVITAHAGFGKTAAVLISLKNERDNIRWYRIEKDDSFLPLFYAHLSSMLFLYDDEQSPDSVSYLKKMTEASGEYNIQNALICQHAWSLYENRKHPLYLVFDDFHNAAGSPETAEAVRYFISNMPACIRIIVMSRTETGILRGKMLLDSRFALIQSGRLLFAEDEAKELLTEKFSLHLSSEQFKEIYSCSEGWAAGLVMAGSPENSTASEELSEGTDYLNRMKRKLHYYFKEFLSGTEPQMMSDLARISLLSAFSSRDLKEVFYIRNAEEITDWLEKSSIYIRKYGTLPVKYRLHPLFRAELEIYLREQAGETELREMYLSAAKYYMQEKEVIEAVRFMIAAGEINEAKNYAAEVCMSAAYSASPEESAAVTAEFPEHFVKSDPYLLFLRAVSLTELSPDESFQCFLGSVKLFEQCGEIQKMTEALVRAVLISFERNNYSYMKRAAGMIPKLKMMLSGKNNRRKLWLLLLMSASLGDRLRRGEFLCRVSERTSVTEPVWEYCFYIAKGMILFRRGLLDYALRNSRYVLDHEAADSSRHLKAAGMLSAGSAFWLKADAESSQKYLEEFTLLAERSSSASALAYSLQFSAYLKHQDMEFEEAAEMMKKSAQMLSDDGSPAAGSAAGITACLWEAETGAPEAVIETAERELKKISLIRPGQGFEELAQAAAGALYKECGNYTESEKLLLRAWRTSRRKKSMQSMCGALLHLADLSYRTNNLKKEKKYLMLFAAAAAEYGYEYFREMSFASLVRVCARCIKYGFSRERMLKIITRYFGKDGAYHLNEDPESSAADPVEFIISHNPALSRQRTVRAEFFGNFRLAAGKVQISQKDWKTKKSGGILKYILASGGKAVSRDVLVASFWPDSDSKAAYASLRVALYELRRILAHFGMAFDSSTALLEEKKNGFVLCEGIVLETDTEKFAAEYKKLKNEDMSEAETKKVLMNIAQMYKGDFLPEDTNNEWVSAKRDQYRSMFAEASHALAAVHMNDSEFDDAEALLLKLLETDSTDETACGMLIRLYRQTNQTSRASSLKRMFEKRFEAEMGVKADLKL